MKASTKKNLVLELDEDEITFIRNLTQNYLGEQGDETQKEKKLRLSFFVASSRALGYDINDDGSVNRVNSNNLKCNK